jgi:DNA-binding NtrC family response regulator
MAGKSVLIVGENGIITFHIHRILIQAGYVPEDPIAAKEIPDRLSNPPLPDLIVLDEGISCNPENLWKANQIFRKCDVPVVILTSFSDIREAERLMGIPHALFVAKPFSGDEVLVAVKRRLDEISCCPSRIR